MNDLVSVFSTLEPKEKQEICRVCKLFKKAVHFSVSKLTWRGEEGMVQNFRPEFFKSFEYMKILFINTPSLVRLPIEDYRDLRVLNLFNSRVEDLSFAGKKYGSLHYMHVEKQNI